jgi:hypothetical protein
MTHLDTDVLAEFRAGLITGRRGAKISAHLAGCDHCAALDDRLAGVSALLASVPAPVMPDRVAQRLDTVLAAEVAKKDYPERAGASRSPDRETHERPARNRRFRLASWRVLAPAAAVVLLGAGGYGLSRIGGGPAMQGAATSAGSAAKAASGARAPVAAPFSGASASSHRMSPANVIVVTSHTDFLRATLGQQLQAELRVSPAPGTKQAASTLVQACVQDVADGASLVRVVSARFEGQLATIIVVRTSKGEKALVAGASCSATNRDVLATTSLP